MPTILVVAPGPLCRNPRPLKEAIALAAAGYDVTALTGFISDEHIGIDRALLRESTVKLVVAKPPRRVRYFWQRARVWVARNAVARFGIPSAWALGAHASLFEAVQARPADLTIVHSEIPLWIGHRLLTTGRRIAADIEDWHSEDLLPEARRSRPLALLRKIESSLLQRAAYCTTTSASLAAALAARYGGRTPAVLPNVFPLQPVPLARPSRPPELVWFSQTIGPGRGLEEFLRHWAKLPASGGRLTLLGRITPSYAAQLRAILPPDCQSRLSFHEPVRPSELPTKLAKFDVGLALEHNEPASRNLTITNKIFQYLNAGLAVIATPTAGQIEVMKTASDAGLLLDFNDPDAHTTLHQFLQNSTAIGSAQIAARRAAEQCYCWERHAPTLLNLVEQALRSPA